MLTTMGVGWVFGSVGVLAAAMAGFGALAGLISPPACFFFSALAIASFGVGCLATASQRCSRRATRAVQQAFELGVAYGRQRAKAGDGVGVRWGDVA